MARILVVDDDDPVRWTLASVLRARGHIVEEATNGQQALACFAAYPCDVVLLDVRMPSMDGLEACRQLRQRTQVPILMISTNGDPVVRRHAFACGATAFIRKPLSVERLLLWLGRVISNGRDFCAAPLLAA